PCWRGTSQGIHQPASAPLADHTETATARVTATSTGLVVVERTVRDRGQAVIVQARAADRAHDGYAAAGSSSGVRTADNLIFCERTAAAVKGPTSGRAPTEGCTNLVEGAPAAPAAAVSGDRLVGGEGAVQDGEARVIRNGASLDRADLDVGTDNAPMAP